MLQIQKNYKNSNVIAFSHDFASCECFLRFDFFFPRLKQLQKKTQTSMPPVYRKPLHKACVVKSVFISSKERVYK